MNFRFSYEPAVASYLFYLEYFMRLASGLLGVWGKYREVLWDGLMWVGRGTFGFSR